MALSAIELFPSAGMVDFGGMWSPLKVASACRGASGLALVRPEAITRRRSRSCQGGVYGNPDLNSACAVTLLVCSVSIKTSTHGKSHR